MDDWGSTWETSPAPTIPTHTETMASLRVKRRRRPNVCENKASCIESLCTKDAIYSNEL
jgi:hypothetical protein